MENYLEQLPDEIVNKMYLYMSHPAADLFKESKTYQSFYKDFPNGEESYTYDGEDIIYEPCFIQYWSMIQDIKHEQQREKDDSICAECFDDPDYREGYGCPVCGQNFG